MAKRLLRRIVLVGLYTGWLGWEGIRHGHQDQAASSDVNVRG